jgi:hypothetical protein
VLLWLIALRLNADAVLPGVYVVQQQGFRPPYLANNSVINTDRCHIDIDVDL